MFYWGLRKPVLDNVIFRQNKARNGGALLSTGWSYQINGITFEDNVATEAGGGVYIHHGGGSFDRAVFKGNSAKKGGAISIDNTSTVSATGDFTNCLFVENTATEQGGVCYYESGAGDSPVFTNCTFYKDNCTETAGGNIIYYQRTVANEPPKFYNCLISKAETGVFYAGTNADQYEARYNLTNYTLPSTSSIKDNIITSDLGLTNVNVPAGDDGLFGTADDGLKPSPTSPAVNAGFNEFMLNPFAWDISGYRRTSGPFVDMGAYETQQVCEQTTAAIAINQDQHSAIPLSAAPLDLMDPNGGCRTMGIFTALNTELQVDNYLYALATVDVAAPSYGSHPYLRRHYDLWPYVDSDEHHAKVTLYFNPSDFENYNANRGSHNPLPLSATDEDIANVRIWQWHGTSTTHTPGSYTKNSVVSTGKYITPDEEDIVWNEALRRWEITFEFSGFSGFFVTTLDPSVLPVTLSSFTVTAQNIESSQASALLQWSTVVESNSKSFVVERSITGKIWEQIGEIRAGGSSASMESYTFTDAHPFQGNNLYRLKMVDLDGTFAYSSIRSLHVELRTAITLYPNPVADRLYIDAGNNPFIKKAVLRDAAGRQVGQYPNVSNGGISVKDLTPGIYIVELMGADGVVERRKIVVER